jgi:hypothetical protein
MNVNSGGKQSIMHDTFIPDDCPIVCKRGAHQSMVFLPHETADITLVGKPKGMARVCEERGLLDVLRAANKGKVIGTCQYCRASAAKRAKFEEEARKKMEEEGERVYLDDAAIGIQFARNNCCMSRILTLQSDFKNEKSMLELVIQQAGHKCIFLPKFHCELNPIEMLWGYAKRGAFFIHPP